MSPSGRNPFRVFFASSRQYTSKAVTLDISRCSFIHLLMGVRSNLDIVFSKTTRKIQSFDVLHVVIELLIRPLLLLRHDL